MLTDLIQPHITGFKEQNAIIPLALHSQRYYIHSLPLADVSIKWMTILENTISVKLHKVLLVCECVLAYPIHNYNTCTISWNSGISLSSPINWV